MDSVPISFSKKEKRTILIAVTLGNLLEWYEIYLYVYWAPIISTLFFGSNSPLINLTDTFLIFAVGFLARPLGGIFFGRLGDRIGRKKSLILSLLIMTIPTFVTGLLPTHAQIGIFAPIILCLMRLLQSFPAGGELPGAICYLYESSHFQERRYMSSWASVGYQVGILISTIECFVLEKYLSTEALITWGWRVSFLLGGLIGLFGLFLRFRLHETPVYREMIRHEKIVKEPILGVVYKHRKGLLMGILFCALNSSSFYLLTANFPVFLGRIFGSTYSDILFITIFLLILITLPLPFFGWIADKFNNKIMLIGATGGILFLLFPLYISITDSSLLFMVVLTVIFSLLVTFVSALLPFLLAHLFPPNVRFTCVGISFNLVDAIIGGFTPVMALYLTNYTGNQASFCWILFFGAIVSLISFIIMKKDRLHRSYE